jgi:hypothetical protein
MITDGMWTSQVYQERAIISFTTGDTLVLTLTEVRPDVELSERPFEGKKICL